jgi:putative flippase GtrA
MRASARAHARTGAAYGAVAVVCLGLHNGVMIGSNWLGAPLWGSVLASFGLVALVGYGLHCWLTFRAEASLLGLARYCGAMAANIPLSYLATWGWQAAGLTMLYAAPAASVCMVGANFVLSRWAILARGPRAKGDMP